MANILDWVCLSLIPGLGATGIERLLDCFGSPCDIFQASAKNRAQVTGIRAEALAGLASENELRKKGEHELERLASFGARAICRDDPEYPPLLRQINSPPPVLYIHGNSELLGQCCIAIVGSRAATHYGRRIAASLACDLARQGMVVVSGLALGIDTEAHVGALSTTGATVAVLGCGLDVIYPQHNSRLYQQIRERGLLLTEYPLGTRPDAFRFPARNRIIAGMSYGVVVVEAAQKSGSLITAGMALEEGREVFAVPGQIDSFKSAGTHWLVQQGAKLITSVADIIEELPSCQRTQQTTPSGTEAMPETTHLEPATLALLELIEPYPMKRDALIALSACPAGRVAEFLLLLELEGLVEMLPGDELRRIDGNGIKNGMK